VGGRREGDAFIARERPVGVVREGGRNDGNDGDADSLPPLNAMPSDDNKLTYAIPFPFSAVPLVSCERGECLSFVPPI
jgi:hypothetical protein